MVNRNMLKPIRRRFRASLIRLRGYKGIKGLVYFSGYAFIKKTKYVGWLPANI